MKDWSGLTKVPHTPKLTNHTVCPDCDKETEPPTHRCDCDLI